MERNKTRMNFTVGVSIGDTMMNWCFSAYIGRHVVWMCIHICLSSVYWEGLEINTPWKMSSLSIQMLVSKYSSNLALILKTRVCSSAVNVLGNRWKAKWIWCLFMYNSALDELRLLCRAELNCVTHNAHVCTSKFTSYLILPLASSTTSIHIHSKLFLISYNTLFTTSQ